MSDLFRLSVDKLSFDARPGEQSESTLGLENLTDGYLAFKVKTTAPKGYLVKPSNGVLEPNGKKDISIHLLPQFEPPKNPNGDRFLVQAVTVQSDRTLSKEDWSEVTAGPEKNGARSGEQRLAVAIKWNAGAGGGGMDSTFSALTSRPIPADYAQLRALYEELVNYVAAVDKHRREIETENEALRANRASGPRKAHSSSAIELWQVGAIIVAVVLLLKAIKFL